VNFSTVSDNGDGPVGGAGRLVTWVGLMAGDVGGMGRLVSGAFTVEIFLFFGPEWAESWEYLYSERVRRRVFLGIVAQSVFSFDCVGAIPASLLIGRIGL